MMSIPQASTSRRVVPRPVIASTTSKSVGERRTSFAIASDIMPCAGGTFGRLHINAADLGRQLAAHFVERKCFAIGSGHGFHGAAKRLGQRGPALAELAGGQHEHAVAGRSQVRDRGFHETGARRGQHEHVVLCADELLHVGQHAREQSAELGRAMMRAIGSHRRLRLREEGAWVRE
jgi:hypothetical protein